LVRQMRDRFYKLII